MERNPPRFVPTLTEVVTPPVQQAAAPTVQEAPTEVDQEELVQRIVQLADKAMQSRLRDAVNKSMETQVRLLAPLLREQVEEVVRRIVSESLGGKADPDSREKVEPPLRG